MIEREDRPGAGAVVVHQRRAERNLPLVDALKVRDPDLSAVFVPFRLEREGLPA